MRSFNQLRVMEINRGDAQVNLKTTPVNKNPDLTLNQDNLNPELRPETEKLVEEILSGRELVLRPHWKAEIPLVALGIVVCAVFAYGHLSDNTLSLAAVDGLERAKLLTVRLVELAVPPLLFAAIIAHRLFNNRFIIRKDYFINEKGIISFRKRFLRLPYSKITGIESTSNLWTRLVGLGTIRLSTPFFDQPEILIPRVKDPAPVHQILSRIRTLVEKNVENPIDAM